jgi:hypothetical protein
VKIAAPSSLAVKIGASHRDRERTDERSPERHERCASPARCASLRIVAHHVRIACASRAHRGL